MYDQIKQFIPVIYLRWHQPGCFLAENVYYFSVKLITETILVRIK